MQALRLSLPSGRLLPLPFILRRRGLCLGVASQWLTVPAVIDRAGLWPFVVAQVVLIWVWYALHAKRLHDGGRGPARRRASRCSMRSRSRCSSSWRRRFSIAGEATDANSASALGLILFVLVVSVLLGSPQYDLAWAMVAILTAVALVPVIVGGHIHALGRQAADPRRGRRRDAALRLRLEYEPPRHAPARAQTPKPSARPGCRATASSLPPTAMRPSRRSAAHIVHGVLWRLTPRDRVTLDAWESVAAGEYGVEILPVRPCRPPPARVGLCGAAAPCGRRKAWLHGSRDCRGPGMAIARSLHCVLTAFGAEAAARGGPRKFGEFGWT